MALVPLKDIDTEMSEWVENIVDWTENYLDFCGGIFINDNAISRGSWSLELNFLDKE